MKVDTANVQNSVCQTVSWTPEQEDAINAEGRAIFVSAAAGSGKTAVLVEKLKRMLCDRKKNISADKIIVVTFTNDAAAQMKQRLNKAFEKELARLYEQLKSDDDEHKKETEADIEWISSQAALLPSAKISTIHSFCFNLIRENGEKIGIDSGFKVMNDKVEAQLVSTIIDRTFESWSENKSNEIYELLEFFCSGDTNIYGFKKIAERIRIKLLTQPFTSSYMENTVKYYSTEPDENDNKQVSAYLDFIKDQMSLIITYAAKTIEQLEPYKDDIGNSGIIRNVIEEAEDVIQKASDYYTAPDKIFNGEIGRITKEYSILSKSPDKETIKDILSVTREKYLDIAESFFTVETTKKDGTISTVKPPSFIYTKEEIRQDFLTHSKICKLMFSFISDVLEEEKACKLELNSLGFSDAEQYACQLLCDEKTMKKTKLAQDISENCAIIMIDEFQDSSEVQELIFRLISKDGAYDRAGTNFFAVGDVKQSIYRFRSANPEIFINNLKNSVLYNGENDTDKTKPAHILLNKNFRSSKPVIDFVNSVFQSIMSERFGGLDYGTDDMLIQGKADETEPAPTEILSVCNKDIQQVYDSRRKEFPDYIPDSESSENNLCTDIAEAKIVAQRIRQLLDSDRSIKYSDICILAYGKANFGLYQKELKNLGIPSVSSAESSTITTGEINVIINILRILDNPCLDIAMTVTLMSPLFMFSADDIARIQLIKKNGYSPDIFSSPNSALFQNMKSLAAYAEKNTDAKINHPELFENGLAEKCREFTDFYERLKDYSFSHTAEELVRHIFDITDYSSLSFGTEDRNERTSNLRKFAEAAAAYDEQSSNGLSGFVRYLNKMIDNGADIESSSGGGSEDNAVSIKTIHKSKGLEYPYVFLCDTSSNFKLSEANFCFDPSLTFAFRICRETEEKERTIYDSFPFRILSGKYRKDAVSSYMMLFYVALTRAKTKLFITSQTISENNDDSDAELSVVSPFGDDNAAMIKNMLKIYYSEEPYAHSSSTEKILSTINKNKPEFTKLDLVLRSCKNFNGWLLAALLNDKSFKGAFALSETECGCSDGESTADARARFTETTGNTLLNAEYGEEEEPVPAEADEALAKQIRENLKNNYSDIDNKTLAKVSVSEIAKKHEERFFNVFTQKSVKKTDNSYPPKLNAAQRGTAVHAFMEHADFKKLYNSRDDLSQAIAEEKKRLCAADLISQIQSDCASEEMISAFVRSSLFERMCKAENDEIFKEKKFLVKISDLNLDDSKFMSYNNSMLQGVADCIFAENDGYVLIDYKTDSSVSRQDLIDRYTDQLKLYAAAFTLILGKKVTQAYIYSFELGEEITISL